jgi:hypothetical protein
MKSRGTTSRTCISQPAGGTGAFARIRPIVNAGRTLQGIRCDRGSETEHVVRAAGLDGR